MCPKAESWRTRWQEGLCNALVTNIGHAQIRNGKHVESDLITSGDDLKTIPQFLKAGERSYRAADVVARLLGTRVLHS
jgi:hypothetical protein